MKLSATSVFLALAYASTSVIVGSQFLSAFTFEAIADPTDGFVTYLSESAAQSAALISTTSTSFRMGADHTTVLSAS
ncbi:glycoside hydrolase family 16 protein [Athelia psychrophila]|uniref:Glycoside hydrolase family 16 protein n=1 Tax=Athelia psychrophila TaxID=1759441 RepID=A0A166KGB2_9AGAM|nr:glycoside hydrolase family 16 protein [Fibularhizoctonia sp. CBS 109695]